MLIGTNWCMAESVSHTSDCLVSRRWDNRSLVRPPFCQFSAADMRQDHLGCCDGLVPGVLMTASQGICSVVNSSLECPRVPDALRNCRQWRLVWQSFSVWGYDRTSKEFADRICHRRFVAFIYRVPQKQVLRCGLIGAAGLFVFALTGFLGQVAAYFLAATLVALLSEITARMAREARDGLSYPRCDSSRSGENGVYNYAQLSAERLSWRV